MKWSYRRYAVEPSRICPSGTVYRPEAKIRVAGTNAGIYLRALIDTGADHTVLPYSIAVEVGADLFTDDECETEGLGGHVIPVVPGQVELELLAGNESHKWKAVVGFAKFASPDDECNVLGHGGFLEFFHANFDGKRKVVELVPQDTLPAMT